MTVLRWGVLLSLVIAGHDPVIQRVSSFGCLAPFHFHAETGAGAEFHRHVRAEFPGPAFQEIAEARPGGAITRGFVEGWDIDLSPR